MKFEIIKHYWPIETDKERWLKDIQKYQALNEEIPQYLREHKPNELISYSTFIVQLGEWIITSEYVLSQLEIQSIPPVHLKALCENFHRRKMAELFLQGIGL